MGAVAKLLDNRGAAWRRCCRDQAGGYAERLDDIVDIHEQTVIRAQRADLSKARNA